MRRGCFELQQQSRQTRLFMLKWTGKLAVLSLVISLWASPVMACMLPDIALTVEERECCKDMANECGQMDMPSSHSCCKLTVRDIDSYLINARYVNDLIDHSGLDSRPVMLEYERFSRPSDLRDHVMLHSQAGSCLLEGQREPRLFLPNAPHRRCECGLSRRASNIRGHSIIGAGPMKGRRCQLHPMVFALTYPLLQNEGWQCRPQPD